ncbi:hypothetical protein DL89DRAFT_263694 [Linderina pennispora]|uniref:Endonuclease/exonuclease/phosphatase domain-containing protein n=1 Tax=Linderina pennispora TaxID=61395 RepID=A0A1Y1WJY0_9FUNG|nr:uncharacterized protein DL89DRAFT_263694 [Linderina pennispora]ORX73665.1 hypothetical protein DL89DRAFT_263694 [Linderina pennispora]
MELALPGELLTYDYLVIPAPLRLDKVVNILEHLDADIVCLQEIDIGNKRSGGGNHAQIIAERLKLNGTMVVEFQELESPARDEGQQGGGIHGNAIYSKYDMKLRPYNWDRDGAVLGEPRRAEVLVPRRPSILAYSAHFECFSGIIGRVGQLSDLMHDSQQHAGPLPHQLVFGDFNTFAHSLARLSPKYACDWYRWRTIGMTEPEWWLKNILSCQILRTAINPGWFDPFDICKDITISNHAGFMTAKADWAFHWMENRDFEASDHRCLVLEIEYAQKDEMADHERFTRRIASELERGRHSRLWTYCSLAGASVLSIIALKLVRVSIMSGTM